jgi:ribose transport system substrate-binding protein
MYTKRTRGRGRLRTVGLVAVIGSLVAGCGGGNGDGGGDGGAGSEDPVQVAFFGPLANTYVEATTQGMNEAAEAGNAELTRFDSGFDASKQFSQIQDAITQGRFDAFIIIPLDAVALVPVVEEAIAADIAVVNTDLALGPEVDTSEPQLEGQAGTVINPPSERGDRILEAVVAACEDLDPCNVGYMAGLPDFDFEREAKARLDTISEDHPHITIVAYQTGHGYVAEPAIGIAQNMLQANPEINVMLVTSDQASAGVEQALQDAGRAEDVRLVSSGGSCPAVQAVEEGRWFSTIIDLPRTEGRIGMEIAIDYVRGEQDGPRGVNPMDSLDREAYVTQENLEGFECEWEG